MLLLCRADLTKADFERLRERLGTLPHPLRWSRRRGRLAILLPGKDPKAPEFAGVVADPAVEFVLKDPTEEEIGRVFSRRDLLHVSLASTGALAAAVVLAPLGLFVVSPEEGRAPGGEVYLGRADAIPPNGAQSKMIEGEEYVVVRQDEQNFHALSATCTHKQVCLVSWDPKRRQLICPCHRGAYDLHGNVVSGPPPRPLARREVVVRDGKLYAKRTGP
jgi:cytochrome b6-f complex iron-sulfur subunit